VSPRLDLPELSPRRENSGFFEQITRRWRGPPNAPAQLRVNVVFDRWRVERFKVNQDFHDAGDPSSLDQCPIGPLIGRRALDFQGSEYPLLIISQVGNRRNPTASDASLIMSFFS
jgi:hypothetical protein